MERSGIIPLSPHLAMLNRLREAIRLRRSKNSPALLESMRSRRKFMDNNPPLSGSRGSRLHSEFRTIPLSILRFMILKADGFIEVVTSTSKASAFSPSE